MLQCMGLPRVGHNLVTEQQQHSNEGKKIKKTDNKNYLLLLLPSENNEDITYSKYILKRDKE